MLIVLVKAGKSRVCCIFSIFCTREQANGSPILFVILGFCANKLTLYGIRD